MWGLSSSLVARAAIVLASAAVPCVAVSSSLMRMTKGIELASRAFISPTKSTPPQLYFFLFKFKTVEL
jgi:hypothetical protein